MDPKILVNSIKIGAVASLFTPFIRPMDFYFPFVGPKSIYFMAVVEIMFFLWIILAWRWKQYRPNIKNPVVVAIAVFLAVALASGIFGADFSASFWSKFERMDGILMLFHLGAFALVLSLVLKSKDWPRFFYASIFIAIIIGIEALFDRSSMARGGGLIGNDSFWGTYILFNIFIALYLAIVSSKEDIDKKAKIFGWPAFLILSACLLLEGSQTWGNLFAGAWHPVPSNLLMDILDNGARAAKISFLAGLALLGALWMATRKRTILKGAGIVVLCAGMAAVLFAAVYTSRNGAAVYQSLVNKFGEGTIRGRLVVWESAWKGFEERPLLGWGLENFNLAFVRDYNPCMGAAECSGEFWFDRAHNIVFDTLVTTGILGMLAYVALFATAIYALWKAYFSGKSEFAAAGVFTALFAAYFLQNLTVFDMMVSYLMWFICLGFAAHAYAQEGDDAKVWALPLAPRYVIAPAIAAVICLGFFVLAPLSADQDVVAAASAPYGSAQRLQLTHQALESSPLGKHQIALFLSHQWVEGVRNPEISKQMTKDAIQENYSFLADKLEECGRESPLDFQIQLELGRLYNSWSLFDISKIALAEDRLMKAKAISPKNQQSYWELAQTRVYQRRFADAINLTIEAYNLYPHSTQSREVFIEVGKIVEIARTADIKQK